MKYKVLAVVLLVLTAITIAYADELIAETGLVYAEGDGTVALNGSGEVVITGEGTLFVVDRTDAATIDIESKVRLHHKVQQARGNTVHIYYHFDGTASISGEDIAVVMDGINIMMSVSGTGAMLVDGKGSYIINDDQAQRWSDHSDLIRIGAIEP